MEIKNIRDELAVIPGGIASKVLVKSEDLNVTLFAVSAGQEISEHTAKKRAMIQITDGEGEFAFEGKWQPVVAGDHFVMPANLVHSVRATTDLRFLLFLFV